MNVEHEGSQVAKRHFDRALDRASDGGSWMAAVWCVEDGDIKLVQRTTFKFPTGDFLAAVGQLASNLFEEVKSGGDLPSDPLPEADLVGSETVQLPTVANGEPTIPFRRAGPGTTQGLPVAPEPSLNREVREDAVPLEPEGFWVCLCK